MAKMKLGKQSAKLSPKTFNFSSLLQNDLIQIPEYCNWANGFTWPMWCNDTLGCCTQVSVASAIRIWTVTTKKPMFLTDADVIANYSAESGYVPGNEATDQGGVELDVLSRWVKTGYQGPAGINKLFAFGSVNFKNINDVKRSIYALGGCYIGLTLPEYAVELNGSNEWFIDDDADNSIAGGHAVFLHGYDDNFLFLNTWGREWKMTYDFFEKYCDEAYGLVSNDWLDGHSHLSPLKESVDQLITEMKNS